MIEEPALEERLAAASNLMALQMAPFVTPISGVLDDNSGKHVGSGGYVHWRGKRLLLTNDHVAKTVSQHPLARKCFDSEDYLRITNPFTAKAAPFDLAVSPVDDHWNSVRHSAMAFPDHRFEQSHAPRQAEYLFLLGFTGEKSYFSAMGQTLFTPGTPYLTQEYDETLEPEKTRRSISHPAFDPHYHFPAMASGGDDSYRRQEKLDPARSAWDERLVGLEHQNPRVYTTRGNLDAWRRAPHGYRLGMGYGRSVPLRDAHRARRPISLRSRRVTDDIAIIRPISRQSRACWHFRSVSAPSPDQGPPEPLPRSRA